MSIKKNLMILSRVYDASISKLPFIEDIQLPLRSQIILNRYKKRRERYNKICVEKKLLYSKENTISLLKKRFADNATKINKKEIGQIHTFAFIPIFSWHYELLDDLYELGNVTHFDYLKFGFCVKELHNARSAKRLELMNDIAFNYIKGAHSKEAIDWIFLYGTGAEISPSFLQKITNELRIPTVIMCLDDKQSWVFGEPLDTHRKGQVDLVEHADLNWTSSRVACEWSLAENGRPIYLPEGCNSKVYYPKETAKNIEVSFLGQKYGYRASVIRYLQRNSINVNVFGNGWGTKYMKDEMEVVSLYNRSKINLGLGGIGAAEYLTNVKGRDFSIPCTGGGLYLTSFNPDLALHFNIGKEILCYRSREEMVELIRYYLKHSDEAEEISIAGRNRCLREHRWLHRYIEICKTLGIL